MKYIITLLALCASVVAAESIPTTGFYVDLYGNLFKDGQNLNRKAGDYVREFPTEAPAIDAALTDVALRGREYIAAQIAAKDAEKIAAIAAANAARDAAVAANAAELTAKTSRVAALEAHLAQLNTYIAGLRGTIAGLGGTSSAPPTAPTP